MNLAAAVTIADLTVRRGGRITLDALTCEVPTGSVTGLVGPSGGGKTTLIRCIAGIQIVQSGTVRVLGAPAGTPALRHRVGYVTQSSSVYPDLTVRENLRYFAAVSGAARTAVDEALERVDLGGYRSQLVGRLSGGQRTRVSLAAALVADPDLYLLDEPTVGLDPVLRRDLWAMFSELADRGKTLLVSSHVMDEAARCDRVLLLRDGRLVAEDTPTGLRARAGTQDLEQAFLRIAEGVSA